MTTAIEPGPLSDGMASGVKAMSLFCFDAALDERKVSRMPAMKMLARRAYRRFQSSG